MKYLMKYVELEDDKTFDVDNKYIVIDSWTTDTGVWFILQDEKEWNKFNKK